jgi:hypothetical protein
MLMPCLLNTELERKRKKITHEQTNRKKERKKEKRKKDVKKAEK